MAQISKKEYRQEIKLMKDLIKGIAVVAEQGTEYTDRERTIEACAVLQQRAQRLAHIMRMIIIEEQKGIN
jgi:hypothetical protein